MAIAVFMATTSDVPWWMAGVAGLFSMAVATAALALAVIGLAHFTGLQTDSEDLHKHTTSVEGTAALLLVAAVFIWLQTGRQRLIDKVASCVGAVSAVQWETTPPRQIVRDCAAQTDYHDDE